MDFVLDDAELRVLGCLIEKEMTTPEYYPLSLNALTNACNQKSNRNPVFAYDEGAVLEALNGLKQKGFARETHAAGSRVTKYLHEVLSRYDLSRHEMAVLCELMLRGPQTPGELRSNAGRMAQFAALEEIDATLTSLMEHVPPLVQKLQREPGRKESRYSQLFSGVTEAAQGEPASSLHPAEKSSQLEEEVVQIRKELEELKQAFAEFKAQFS